MQAGDTAYVWNKHPQLAVKKQLVSIEMYASKPYGFDMYGARCYAESACSVEQGHPARDLEKELLALFPEQTYGHSALTKGQAAILLAWVNSLPIVFVDGTEQIVHLSIQDGTILVEEKQ